MINGSDTCTNNGASRAIKETAAAVNGSLFGSDLVVKACERGKPEATSREVCFELTLEDIASLQQWAKRDVIDQ